MADRRVVVTGMGVLACNGIGVTEFWDALKNGRHGIGPIQGLSRPHTTTFAGQIRLDDLALAGGDRRIARRKDRFVHLALKAAAEAMAMSGLDYKNWKDPFRVATIVGAGIGGLGTIEAEHDVLRDRGPTRVSPFLVPKMIVDSAAGDISIVYGAKGPNYAITTACATGSHCIGAAFHHIRSGLCDAAITGGTEAPITDLGLSGFNSIGALSTRNDSPGTASRPFDKDREGFVIAEGAGILILEELEHAKARGARIYGEIAGYGATSDGHDMVAPSGEGAVRCMRMALQNVKAPVDYINPHATATPVGDLKEIEAIREVFGSGDKCPPISATKSLTGHSLGATGVQEAIYSLLMMQNRFICESAHIDEIDPAFEDMNIVRKRIDDAKIDTILSNSFGFGGTNATLVFSRYNG